MFDTLQYSQRLQAAGVEPELANAQARALQEAMHESVATKAQLEAVEQHLSARIDALEQRLTSELKAGDQRLSSKIDTVELHLIGEMKVLRWMVGAALTLLVAVFVKLVML